MRLRTARADHYVGHVVPRLLAAPAELLLDALPPVDPGARVLEIGAGAGALSVALAERLAGLAKMVALDEERALAAMLPEKKGAAARVVATPDRLPVATGAFDLVLANLVVGDAAEDARTLPEARRALRPRGWLLATALLQGSFDELFDVFGEACEGAEQHGARGALQDARASLSDEASLQRALAAHGFDHVHTGVEERALFFARGADVVEDPFVKDVLLATWTKAAPLSADAVKRAAQAVDTYFAGGRFPVRVRTAVLLARAR